MNSPLYIVGDPHGCCRKLVGLLESAGLLDADQAWAGGESRLFFLGDYMDRGPDGIGVVDLVMRLQGEARAAGGQVEALLGNHDVMLLAARRFGNFLPPGADLPLRYLWQQNGGRVRDLNRLTESHVAWLAERPALALADDALLLHADSTFYADYGAGIADVNAAFAAVLGSGDYMDWMTLIVGFVRRLEFDEANGGSTALVQEFLHQYGATRLVHGHTPIPYLGPNLTDRVTSPWVYADGLCTNVDGGLFLGQPGFVYELLPEGDDRDPD